MSSSELELEKGSEKPSLRNSGDLGNPPPNLPALNPTVPEPTPDRPKGIYWVLTLIVMYSAALMYGIDTTIVADIQVPIIQALGHVDQLTWIGTGFPLGSVAVILPLGVMYGIFNVKWVFLCGIVMFEVGSAVCGAAPSMNALIVGRVIAGMGGAAIYLGCALSVILHTLRNTDGH
jgi:MFS family permease